jgi:hypothetical protein
MQARLTADETDAQRAAAREMQRNWWELRMILNEVRMLRSLNPRLLQSGNFGFTDAEMLEALGARPSRAARAPPAPTADCPRLSVPPPRRRQAARRHGCAGGTARGGHGPPA